MKASLKNMGMMVNPEKLSLNSSNHMYYNVLVTNPATATSHIEASVQEVKSQAILNDPSEYYCSIVRFSVPASAIPIFYARIIDTSSPAPYTSRPFNRATKLPNGGPPYFMPYTVKFTFGATNALEFLEYTPVSFEPFDADNSGNSIALIFSYDDFINSLNVALTSAWAVIAAANPGNANFYSGGGGGPIRPAPFMIYNPETSLFTLNSPDSLYNPVNSTSGPKLWFNTQLLNFFNSFNYGFYQAANSISGEDFNIYVQTKGNPVQNRDPTDATRLLMICEYETISQWTQLSDISFTTQTIPIRPELIPVGSSQQQTSANYNTRKIMTDFEPSGTGAAYDRSNYQYYPQGPYRLIDMISKTPMTQFDIKAEWTSIDGITRPIHLNPGFTFNVKVLFVKKSSYDFNNYYSS